MRAAIRSASREPSPAFPCTGCMPLQSRNIPPPSTAALPDPAHSLPSIAALLPVASNTARKRLFSDCSVISIRRRKSQSHGRTDLLRVKRRHFTVSFSDLHFCVLALNNNNNNKIIINIIQELRTLVNISCHSSFAYQYIDFHIMIMVSFAI